MDPITNTDNFIYSNVITARIKELKNVENINASEEIELSALEELQEKMGNITFASGDVRLLIRNAHFLDYAQDTAKRLQRINYHTKDMRWPYNHIDSPGIRLPKN